MSVEPGRRGRNGWFVPVTVLLAFSFLMAASAFAQQEPQRPPVTRGAEVVEIVSPFVFEGDLRTLPVVADWQPGDPIKEIPRRFYGRPDAAVGPPVNPTTWTRDPLLDLQFSDAPSSNLFSVPDLNLAGQGYTGVNPPDTVGDVGQNYYIQMINASGGAVYRIHDKNTGAVVAGPTLLDTLGSGFCANGLGDPVVLYDHLANRWMLSEFSSSGSRLCVYISQTSNPITGGWYNYDFQAVNFPDYPKYGVWPDAYYVSTNENSPAAYALQRSQMLVGGAAAVQRFTAPDLGGFGFQALTPADLDGPAPPAGAPNYFIRHNDDEAHNPGGNNPSNDYLELFEFHVDFATPANSTFTGPIQVAITEIDSSLCGLTSFSCIQQPGTSVRLDPLREVVMWRHQYRNFGTHQTLIGSLATDVDGTDHSGVRWFELRKIGAGPWTLFQEGTYAIDANSRWMSSAAMDASGNIAVGYNVGSSALFPGLRYAGRLVTDPAGSLPQGENTLINGSASNGSNRYGDYASLNVDPVDGCTLWFTGEYNSASQWSTRIGRFRFASCGASSCGDGTCNVGENQCTCPTDCGTPPASETGLCNDGQDNDCDGLVDCADPNCSSDPACLCDNDFVCETGENCMNCPNDCIGGTSSGAVCGNGTCEAGNGENCLNCPADCNGLTSGKPANRFCCGGGAGNLGCADSRCTTGGFSCTTVPSGGTSYCCGDGMCQGNENTTNCPIDCGSPPQCGAKGASCTSGSQCCSGVCKANGTCR